jgi:hypothetical protein
VGAVGESCSRNVRTPPSAGRGDVERKKESKIKTKIYKREEEKKKNEN